MTSPNTTKSRRGRPAYTEDDIQRERERIAQATHELVGRQGTIVTTVEDVLCASNIGRSTFYRYFSNLDELLEQLIEASCQRMLAELNVRLDKATSIDEKGLAAIDGYISWARSEGPFAAVLAHEGHVPTSIVRRSRSKVLKSGLELFAKQVY